MSDALTLPELSVRPRLHKVLGGTALGPRLARVRESRQHNGATFTNPVKTRVMHPDQLWRGAVAMTKSFGKQRPPSTLPMATDTHAQLHNTTPTSALRMTWLGHSTTLVELDGLRFLTDPVFGPRASPAAWMGPLRFHAVPIEVEALPALDAILISHDHYDHLDYPTIKMVAANLDRPPFLHTRFITALGVGAHLEAWGIPAARIVELDWWQDTRIPHAHGSVKITAAPAQHFSGRSVGDRNHTLWVSFMIEGSARVFFSGDTGLGPHFTAIRKYFGAPDVAMLEVGAFHEAWGDIHLGPDNARQAFADLGAHAFVPVHWATFALGAHPWDEPGEQLYVAGTKQGLPLLTPVLGTPFEPSRSPATEPWWRSVR